MGTHWDDKSFDRLRNLPANLKCVVVVTTSPGLPSKIRHVIVANSSKAPTEMRAD